VINKKNVDNLTSRVENLTSHAGQRFLTSETGAQICQYLRPVSSFSLMTTPPCLQISFNKLTQTWTHDSSHTPLLHIRGHSTEGVTPKDPNSNTNLTIYHAQNNFYIFIIHSHTTLYMNFQQQHNKLLENL
jgi:hypothetical protein